MSIVKVSTYQKPSPIKAAYSGSEITTTIN